MSSITERPVGEGGAARPAGFHVAILLGSEIMRRGLNVMLNSLEMVKEVDIWDWESTSRISSIVPGEAPDMLILGFDDLDVEVVDKVAREAGRRGVKVLLLLNRLHEELFDLIAAMPSNGFLMQEELSSDSLATALTGVASGGSAVPSLMARRLLTRAREGGLERPVSPNLTPRENEVLELLVEGLTNKQIARRLRISQHGVKRLVSNVLAKLGCPNRTLAVAMAITGRILADQ